MDTDSEKRMFIVRGMWSIIAVTILKIHIFRLRIIGWTQAEMKWSTILLMDWKIRRE